MEEPSAKVEPSAEAVKEPSARAVEEPSAKVEPSAQVVIEPSADLEAALELEEISLEIEAQDPADLALEEISLDVEEEKLLEPEVVEEPSAGVEPSADIEPSAGVEPSAQAVEEPSAGVEPSAQAVEEPSAGVEPSAQAIEEPSADIKQSTKTTEPPTITEQVSISGPGQDEEEEEAYEFQFDDKPIRSSLAVNNTVLRSMIERFVERLDEHIDAMEMALKDRDYLELVVSCNWVRGEANTLGFDVLNGPITSIELQLRKQKFSQVITHLSELRNMAERIEIKHSATPYSTIQYHVPEHAKNAVIYENFVSQLGTKLLELEVAVAAGSTRQMTQLCRWIERYGTKIKFVEVVEAAQGMQEAIEAEEPELIKDQLEFFIELYGKIEIVKPETT